MFGTIQTTANLSASFSLSMSPSGSLIGWVTRASSWVVVFF